MQDEIVARLANALAAQVVGAEARQAERSSSPGATDLFFRAQAYMNRGFTAENVGNARDLFEQALALDGDDVSALTGLASANLVIATTFIPDNRAALFDAVERALARVLSLAPDSAIAHFLLGILYSATDRATQGIREFERALELEPNLARAHGQIGMAKIALGRPKEAEAHILEALRLSPRDTVAHLWCGHAGLAKLIVGDLKAAEAWLRRAIETNPNDPTAHFYLSCTLVYMNRLPEARSTAAAGLAINPGYSLARVRAGSSASANFKALADRYIDALRAAGVPEQ